MTPQVADLTTETHTRQRRSLHVSAAIDELEAFREAHSDRLDERSAVSAAIRAQRDDAGTRDTLAEWDGLPQQVERLEDLAQALDTWHSWAAGRDVGESDLTDAISSLRAVHNDWPRLLARSIADVEPEVETRRVAIADEIERPLVDIDFGIDF